MLGAALLGYVAARDLIAPPAGTAGIGSLIFAVIVGAINLAAGLGLWGLRKWSRSLIIAFGVIAILVTVLRFVLAPAVGPPVLLLGWVANIVYGVCVLWYFNRNLVKDSFGLSQKSSVPPQG